MGWEPEENCRQRNYIYSLQQPGGRAHVRNEGLIIIWSEQAVLVHLAAVFSLGAEGRC